jgi:hypothetical protein
VRVAGGVAVGEVGDGEDVGESGGGGVVVEVVAADDGDHRGWCGAQCNRGG